MADQNKHINKLVGKRVLVIGGSSGVGFGAAEAALEHGATVIVSSSNQSRVDSAVSNLQQAYPSKKSQISGIACDLGSDESIEANIEQLLKSATDNGQNKLDHLITSAGDPVATMKLADINIKKLQAAGRIRFFGPLFIAKYATKYMHVSNTSSFTITSGQVAERPIPDWTVVGSFAGGLYSMAQGLALDLAPLRVNAVSPGLVATEMWSGMDAGARDGMFKATAEALPVGAVATPQEIAEAYVYLMKDTNATGRVIQTDGGHSLK